MSREHGALRYLLVLAAAAAVASGAARFAAAQTAERDEAAQSAEHDEASQSAGRDEAATPVDVVERLHDGLAEFAAEADSSNLEQRIERLRPLITSTHDLPYIAELTVRREWKDLPPAHRERFVDAFERLSIATYASRFAELDGDPFRTLEADPADGDRAHVRAEIVPADGEPIPLDYSLQERDGRWRIINIVADGVSDLALKRAEYRRVLAGGTIDDLIAELESQVDAMR